MILLREDRLDFGEMDRSRIVSLCEGGKAGTNWRTLPFYREFQDGSYAGALAHLKGSTISKGKGT